MSLKPHGHDSQVRHSRDVTSEDSDPNGSYIQSYTPDDVFLTSSPRRSLCHVFTGGGGARPNVSAAKRFPSKYVSRRERLNRLKRFRSSLRSRRCEHYKQRIIVILKFAYTLPTTFMSAVRTRRHVQILAYWRSVCVS